MLVVVLVLLAASIFFNIKCAQTVVNVKDEVEILKEELGKIKLYFDVARTQILRKEEEQKKREYSDKSRGAEPPIIYVNQKGYEENSKLVSTEIGTSKNEK